MTRKAWASFVAVIKQKKMSSKRAYDLHMFSAYAPGVYDMNQTQHRRHVTEMTNLDENWSRCAIVGSSSVLLKTPMGKYIDGFDAIFRVNDAPIDAEFLNYTGVREHIRIGTYPIKTKAIRTIYYCHTRWYPTRCWLTTSVDHFPRVSPAFVRTVRRSHNLRKWPTSGLIAYEVANRLCESIEVFGFGIDPSFSNCSHYYNTDRADVRKCVYRYGLRLRNSMRAYKKYEKSPWHEIGKERAFFGELVSGRVKA